MVAWRGVEIRSQIRQFVVTKFPAGSPAPLADDDSLLESGVIDSTSVLELVGFLEREFRITVSESEMQPENLDSIAFLAAFVARKRAAAWT